MKKISSIFCFAILFLILSLSIYAQVMGTGGWRKEEKQIRIPVSTPLQVQAIYNLNLNVDFRGPDFDYIIAYVTPEEVSKIDLLGFPYIVEIEDLNSYNQNFWLTEDAYHTYQEIIDLADSLSSNFPAICKKYIYGYSMESRQLVALKISDNVDTDEPEAEVLFDGGIHGDEVGGPENIIRFARDLCINYGSNPTTTNLVNNREIWLYLMVNPDGRYHDTRYNANGIDINRDCGYMWETGNSPGAFSQVESKILRSFVSGNQFVVHTTYHSGTEYISCPWSYRPDQPHDWNHIYQLAGLYSSLSGYSNLPYGQGYSGMYPINGSTKDYNYGVMGSVSWSLEISLSKHPPASQIMTYYNYNYPSMIALIEYAGYGLQGIVTDATNGNPVTASVFVNNYFPSYTDPTAGDYHKYVLPGTYSITIIANGYQTQTINNVVVTSGNVTTTNFQLQPDSVQYVYKFSASQIPGNNFSDEGWTPGVIGAPDNVNYSIGKNGWCILDMQYPVIDGPGPDFRVYEGDTSPEGFTCYVGETIDGPWISLGMGNGTTSFDIAASGLSEAQFIKILDDGDGVAVSANAGFDLDAIEALVHSSGVYLSMTDYEVDDAAGNNNNKIDPGETVNIIVTIQNNGDITAENISGVISSGSSYITINDASANFGSLIQGASSQGTFTVEALSSTPNGEQVDINLEVTSNSGTYANYYTMNFVVGQIPVLIIDLDVNHNSATNIQAAIQSNGIAAELMASFPGNLNLYSSIFICLGIYSSNHELTSSEGQALADYLTAGGCLYMEGGDAWAYDPSTPVRSMFNINGTNDGSGDLSTIQGITGTFAEGMSFSYSGDNSYIDHIEPIFPAYTIFTNQSPVYNCAVAYDAGSYKTLGSSFEFGGLTDGTYPSTKSKLMYQILDFFELLIIPVELASFTVNVNEGNVILNWTTATEINNMGFEIEKSLSQTKSKKEGVNWKTIGFVNGKGTTTEVQNYFFIDKNVSNGSYLYRLKQIDFNGNFEYSNVVEIEFGEIPKQYILCQNYPNPFNPSTTIKYAIASPNLSKGEALVKVLLIVFDILGNEVVTLVNEEQSAGNYEVELNADKFGKTSLTSGVYFYRLNAGSFTSTKKLMLLK